MNYISVSRRAFTLIELLVVIAIIAILAAILFPVFAQAKLAAKKTQTISNSKSIATGFNLYVTDFDDLFPPLTGAASDIEVSSTLRYMYPGLVDPYIRNGVNKETSEIKDVWADPLSKAVLTVDPGPRSTFAYNTWGLGGYDRPCLSQLMADAGSANCVSRSPALYGDFAATSYNVPASSTELQAPADTIMLVTGEQVARPPQYGVVTGGRLGHLVGIFGSIVGEGDRLLQSRLAPVAHNKAAREKLYVGDAAVVAYTDGHVKLVRNASLWHDSYSSANRKWRGAVKTGPVMNRGWARQFPEN